MPSRREGPIQIVRLTKPAYSSRTYFNRVSKTRCRTRSTVDATITAIRANASLCVQYRLQAANAPTLEVGNPVALLAAKTSLPQEDAVVRAERRGR